MKDSNPQINPDVDKLKKDIVDMKMDIAYLKKIVLQVNTSESNAKDVKDLENIEKNIALL